MKFVFPNTTCTFGGDRKTALAVGYVEVEDTVYNDLVDGKKVWLDGEIVDNLDYAELKAKKEEANRKTAALKEIREIEKWFSDNDWKINKIVTGEWEATDARWVEYLAKRAEKRARQDFLEGLK